MTGRAPAADFGGARALVIGATGFIGRRVVRALMSSHAHVVAVGRNLAILEELRREGAASIPFDLVTDDVGALVRDVRPDVTFNLAGYGVGRHERDATLADYINAAVPAQLAAELVALAVDGWRGLRLVHAGSALEYGDVGGRLEERGPADPNTLYGLTKLAGTQAIAEAGRRYGLRAITARLFTVYGPGERSERLLPSLIDAAVTGRPVELTAGTQRRDFVFVDDVAEGLLRLAHTTPSPDETVNLASGTLLSVREFVERAAPVLGLASTQLLFGASSAVTDEIEHDPVSNARLRSLTGWSPPTTIEEGVGQTVGETTRPSRGEL